MFSSLPAPSNDPILSLIGLHAADPRPEKIDLGIGVYKDDSGITPVFAAVKKAEQQIVNDQESKAYIGPLGDREFCTELSKMVLGDFDAETTALCQTVGGSGALRMLGELILSANPNAKLWCSDVAWPNYRRMFPSLGLPVHDYPYFNAENGSVLFDEMIETLRALGSDDVVLLQASCHNPTGVNLTPTQWDEIAAVLAQNGAIPFVDSAYQGFGDGLEEDAYGLRKIMDTCPIVILATSCSKNFGLYRDRIGLAMVKCPSVDEKAKVESMLGGSARASYSMPADHGAAVVRTILKSPELRKQWQEELEAMRLRMLSLRQNLAEALRARTNSDQFDFLGTQRGMFSLLGISEPEALKIRSDFGVYMLNDSRMNIAGLSDDKINTFVDALMAVRA